MANILFLEYAFDILLSPKTHSQPAYAQELYWEDTDSVFFNDRNRLFPPEVAQGALQRSLQRAPCHHERSS
jgi:hypothetical protein